MPMAEGAGASSTAPSAPASASATTAAADPTSTRARPEEVVVHVVGAVLAPGVVHVAAGARVVDAVAAAGGLAPGADAQRVNLAAPVADGSRIVVPAVGVEVPAEVPTSAVAAAGGPGGTTGGGATPPAGAGELNTATAEQLDGLPGVGPATAEAILAYREANGPFTSVEQLLDVRGIGEAKLESLRDLVVVR
jgi:competence protein ComEA